MRMPPEKFHPERFARNQTHSLGLEFSAAGDLVELPLLVVRGRQPGPVLVASAGVHGDEYEGIQAILETTAALDPAAMRGDLLAVPVVHVAAFRQRMRRSPLDGLDLARVFPGRPDGSPSEVLAWHFDRHVLAHADFYVDLHSGGINWEMPLLAGFDDADPRARAAALAFGAPVIWAHPEIPPGRTVSAARARGIPWIYAEARGGGRVHPDDLAAYQCGLMNLMRHLGMLDGESVAREPQIELFGDGNIDAGLTATAEGFLIAEVRLLDEVTAGAPLGRLLDFWGRLIEEYFAPRSGCVVLVHACPYVRAGEPVFLVTGVRRRTPAQPAGRLNHA
ncbi:MAG: succinylglutamate desuccinylase/aspartoacylase family protein [Bryobacteraceae bacterium]|nr:succinylglutamate desuccinylase/aspartoacylase family protein [Bryobacteraceae bacterium]